MLTLRRNILFSILFHALVAVSVFITGMKIVGEKKNFIVVSFVEEALQSEKPVDSAIPASGKDPHRQIKQKAEMSGTEKAEDSSPLFDEDIHKAHTRSLGSMERIEDAEDTGKKEFASPSTESRKDETERQTEQAALSARPLSNAVVGENIEQEFDSRGLTRAVSQQTGSEHAAGFLSSPAASQASGGPDPLRTIQKAIEKAKHYPYLAKKRGIEGTVTTVFTINQAGNPEQIRIIRSSGSRLLDSAAQKTIRAASPFPRVTGAIEIAISYRLKE
jgi:protein TonB